jgi:hypothetical protein
MENLDMNPHSYAPPYLKLPKAYDGEKSLFSNCFWKNRYMPAEN